MNVQKPAVRLVWRAFDALSPQELYGLLQLRSDVFVVEQNCVFADIDGQDPDALHLLALSENRVRGTLRLFGPAGERAICRIGRVVVAISERGTGLGRHMMATAIEEIERRYPGVPIGLAAQSRLEAFYASVGFERVSADYLEDGILHCAMRRAAATPPA